MSSPFDFINAISEGRGKEFFRKMNGRGYDPFLTNRAFSYHLDTLFAAHRLNRVYVDPDQHAAFLINTVRPRKRYGKWAKAKKDHVIDTIASHYDCSDEQARQYRKLLSKADLKRLADEKEKLSRK
jgi:hypothetical protein